MNWATLAKQILIPLVRELGKEAAKAIRAACHSAYDEALEREIGRIEIKLAKAHDPEELTKLHERKIILEAKLAKYREMHK